MTRLALTVFATFLLAGCGGGGGSSPSVPAPGSGSSQAVSANYFPIAQGNTWTYQGSLFYAISASTTVGGTTVYPYQGGCNAWDYLYKDSSGNVYSIGQTVGGTPPVQTYPQPQLLVKGALLVGDSWTNNLGFVTETVTVGAAEALTINGVAATGYPVTYTDHFSSGPAVGTIVYVANIGPVIVTNFCTSSAVQANLTAYSISPSSL